MNYAINEDQLCDGNSNPLLSEPSLSGIQYSVVTDLTTEPVTIDDFKLHARIDYNTDDALVALYLKSARQYLEGWAQKSFGTKTMKLTALNLPKNYRLMYGPVNAVTAPINTYTTVGDILKDGPYQDVSITFTTAWIIPEVVKVAICLEAAAQYMIREAVVFSVNGTIQKPTELQDRAKRLLRPFMNITFP